MTKQTVISRLGQPMAARGANQNEHGQIVEVLQYRLAVPNQDSPGALVSKSVLTIITLGVGAMAFERKTQDYWLTFVDGRLARWGQAGDWN